MQTQQQHHLHSDSDSTLTTCHSLVLALILNIHVLEQYDTWVFSGSSGLCWNLFGSSRAGHSLWRGATQRCPSGTGPQALAVHWHCCLISPTSASVKEGRTEQNIKWTTQVLLTKVLWTWYSCPNWSNKLHRTRTQLTNKRENNDEYYWNKLFYS